MDNAKFEFVEIPGKHKVIRGEGYEYVIDKTDGVKSYWKCQRKNCKARLLVENNDVDSIQRGKNSHNHEPDMKAQTKITDFLTARAGRGERVSGQVTGEQTEAAGRAVQECSDSDTGMDTRENSTEEEGGGGEEEVEEEEEEVEEEEEEVEEEEEEEEGGGEEEEVEEEEEEEEGGGEEEEEEEVVEDLERDNYDSDSGDQSDVSTNADVESDCRQTDESDKEGGSDSKLESQGSKIPTESQESELVDTSGTESEVSSDENPSATASQKKNYKFVSMNLYKLKTYSNESANSPLEIISKFMDRTRKRYDRKRKATGDSVKSRHSKKKRRRIGENEGEEVDETAGIRSREDEQQDSGDTHSNDEEEEDKESDDDSSLSHNEDRETGHAEASMINPRLLDFNSDTSRQISNHESNFKIKLFELTTTSSSQMVMAVNDIVEAPTHDSRNTNLSYICFFYNDDGRDIYVTTSGQGYRLVEKRACTKFPFKIAKRLLSFRSIEIVTRNVTGDTSQTSKLYLPSSEGTLNIWDLVTVIVNRYTAFPKENSSIYNLDCFKNTKGQQKKISLSLKNEKSIQVNQSTSIEDLLDIVHHFALIDQGKSTSLQKRGESEEMEKDDPQFDQMKYIRKVNNSNAIKTLNQNLDKRIQRLMKDTDETEDLTLSLPDMRKFVFANKYDLFLTKGKKPVYTWDGMPPKLSEVLKIVERHKKCHRSKMTMKWLDQNVKISIMGKRYAVSKCVQGFICSSTQPFFMWHGEWLQLCMEYQDLINKNYFSILDENTIKAETVFPLSWKQKTSKNDHEDKSEFKLEEFVSYLNVTDSSKWTDVKAKELLSKLADLEYDKSRDIWKYKLDDYGATLNNGRSDKDGSGTDESDTRGIEDSGEDGSGTDDTDSNESYDKDVVLFAKIFLRLHAKITEFTFNKTYLLLDKLLGQQSRTKGFIVGDRLLAHNVELFDVLAYNDKDTYLVHVKAGFDKNMRELCAQVRDSADQLYNDLIASKSKKILDQWWDEIQGQIEMHESKAQYKIAVQEACAHLGKKGFQDLFKEDRRLTYVLAVLDTRGKNSILRSDEGPLASLEKCIRKAVGDRDNFVLEKLRKKKYVIKTSSFIVSDKFGMNANEQKFADEMSSTGTKGQTLSKEDWKRVFKALKRQIPQTRSTVLRMQLLELFSYFRRFQIGNRKFQLKICFIPDTNANLVKDLKSFLDLKA